jgi:type II secretory pathway component PulF
MFSKRATREQGFEQSPAVTGVFGLILNAVGLLSLATPTLFAISLVAVLATALLGISLPLAMIVGILILVFFAAGARRLRAERTSRLLGYLGIATRLNLPLPEFLDALQIGEGGAMARQTRRIADNLRAGTSLGEALFIHAPNIPSHQTAVIWRGERMGRLRQAFAHIADRARCEVKDAEAGRHDIALQYTLLTMVVLLGLASAVAAFIIPKYEEIFLDFDAAMPAFTSFTFGWAQKLGSVLLVISALALMWIAGGATYSMRYGMERIHGPLRRLAEPIWWRVPVLSRSTRARAWADACFAIEQAMRTGRPIAEAIDIARHPLQSRVANKKLIAFAQALRDGAAVSDAAKRAGLPPLIVGMLGTAGAMTQPAEVFAFLTRYYNERTSALEVLVRAAILPFVTLLAACMVAWFVFAIFYPLILLIEQTIQHTGFA